MKLSFHYSPVVLMFTMLLVLSNVPMDVGVKWTKELWQWWLPKENPVTRLLGNEYLSKIKIDNYNGK